MSSLLFSGRLDENIQEVRKTKNIGWDGRTVFLEEKKGGLGFVDSWMGDRDYWIRGWG